MKMSRRNRMCETCIFRGISEEDRVALASLEAEEVPCHTDCPMGGGIQCRGHFEARRAARTNLTSA